MSGGAWRRGLLVSVRDAGEAAVAAAAGAAIIDIKEPDRGPLGQADAATAATVLAAVAGRAAVTLACGELAAGADPILAHVGDVLQRLADSVPGPVAVKAGPAAIAIGSWRDQFVRLVDRLPAGIEPVAVAYADDESAGAPPAEVILDQAIEAGVGTLLVDTFDKHGPGLFALVPRERLRAWIERAAEGGVALAVAGRLTGPEVGAGFRLGAAICGVRTAACDGGRHGRVSAPRVRSLATLADVEPPRLWAGRVPAETVNVKSLEVRVPHQLDAAEVRRRLDHGIERARTEYADKVTEIESAWRNDDRLDVTLVVMGMSIASEIDVLPEELAVRLQLPTMAGLFAGRIRSGIEEQLGGLLGARV